VNFIVLSTRSTRRCSAFDCDKIIGAKSTRSCPCVEIYLIVQQESLDGFDRRRAVAVEWQHRRDTARQRSDRTPFVMRRDVRSSVDEDRRSIGQLRPREATTKHTSSRSTSVDTRLPCPVLRRLAHHSNALDTDRQTTTTMYDVSRLVSFT
jgi:hypothetical protein